MTHDATGTAVVYRSSPNTRRILLGAWALCLLLPAIPIAAGVVPGDGSEIGAGLVVAVVLETGSPTMSTGFALLLVGVTALALGVYAFANLIAAGQCFRERKVVPGLIWGALAVLQVLLVLALVGSALPGR